MSLWSFVTILQQVIWRVLDAIDCRRPLIIAPAFPSSRASPSASSCLPQVITDADMEAIVYSGMAQPDDIWSLMQAHVFTGTDAKPTATVTLRHMDGKEVSASCMGTGPIDAVYNAIKEVVGRPNDLTDFIVKSVTDGQNALGEVTIKVSPAEDGKGRRSVAGLRKITSQSPISVQGGAAAGSSATATAMPAGHKQTMSAAAYSSTAAVEKGKHNGATAAPKQPIIDASQFLDPSESTGRPTYSGTATDKDIIVAAAHAYVRAINRMLAADATGGKITGAGAIGSSV